MFSAQVVHMVIICLIFRFKIIKCDDNANATIYSTTNDTDGETDTSSDNADGSDTDVEYISINNETLITLDPVIGNEEVHLENDKQLKVAEINLGEAGHKVFYGGGYSDKFQIDSCNGLLTGELVGGFGYNIIVVGYDCYKRKEINLVVMKDVRILSIGKNVNIIFRRIRHLKFDELLIDFDESQNWNLTFALTDEYEDKQWVTVEPIEAAGGIMCGNYNLDSRNRIICVTPWQRTWIWISLISFCVSSCLFVYLMAFVCVKNKKNAKADFEENSMERYWGTVSRF